MPDIYQPNSHVPELNGKAFGGVSIVLHNPKELEWLYAFSSLAPQPPAAPLKSLAAALADPRLDLIGWHREWASNRNNFMPPATGPDPKRETNEGSADEDLSDLSALRDVLVVLKGVWEAEPDDIPFLSCVVTIESDATIGDTGVSWDTTTANLTFGRGVARPMAWKRHATSRAVSGGTCPRRRNRFHCEGTASRPAGSAARTGQISGSGAAPWNRRPSAFGPALRTATG
jgi:hypothetical protein